MALIDTTPLVALIDPRDQRHRAAARAVSGLPGPTLTTWAVITEALHLLGKAAESRGTRTWFGQEPLARRLQLGSIFVATLTDAMALRALALMEQYADRPMDFADASLVALAEVVGEMRIVTFDTDFYVYRTQSGAAFTVLDGAVA